MDHLPKALNLYFFVEILVFPSYKISYSILSLFTRDLIEVDLHLLQESVLLISLLGLEYFIRVFWRDLLLLELILKL